MLGVDRSALFQKRITERMCIRSGFIDDRDILVLKSPVRPTPICFACSNWPHTATFAHFPFMEFLVKSLFIIIFFLVKCNFVHSISVGPCLLNIRCVRSMAAELLRG